MNRLERQDSGFELVCLEYDSDESPNPQTSTQSGEHYSPRYFNNYEQSIVLLAKVVLALQDVRDLAILERQA